MTSLGLSSTLVKSMSGPILALSIRPSAGAEREEVGGALRVGIVTELWRAVFSVTRAGNREMTIGGIDTNCTALPRPPGRDTVLGSGGDDDNGSSGAGEKGVVVSMFKKAKKNIYSRLVLVKRN
eukprot:CAMPEP_0113533436 /NCGR_PEP_ID=MMETSP0015_2-20120614/4606_1 /TAXON_ID=2838 /ORGANISM="Odontella" /LENGTH=123 /DNA_ID=CAMNT_0000432493 /DNA_START=237 /DNA_END=609 /DNA_ORIENTATION=- /assembly_acc=CAM_ASM_000160